MIKLTVDSNNVSMEADGGRLDVLAEQFPKKQITVIIDDPLNGEIWKYGNAGRKWLRIGITGGYA